MASRSRATFHRNPAVAARIHSAAMEGLERGAREIFDASQQIVPVDTRQLKESGRVEIDSVKGVAELTYTAPHAEIVHERTDLQHTSGKSAKFLERPMAFLADGVYEDVARAIRAVTGR